MYACPDCEIALTRDETTFPAFDRHGCALGILVWWHCPNCGFPCFEFAMGESNEDDEQPMVYTCDRCDDMPLEYGGDGVEVYDRFGHEIGFALRWRCPRCDFTFLEFASVSDDFRAEMIRAWHSKRSDM